MRRSLLTNTKWNTLMVVGFIAICCFAIWLSRGIVGESEHVLFRIDNSRRPFPEGQWIDGDTIYVRRPPPRAPKAVTIKRHRFTKDQRHYIAYLNGYRCQMCRALFSHDLKTMDIDHKTPLSCGGADWPHLYNLQPLCVLCHRRKTVQERKQFRG